MSGNTFGKIFTVSTFGESHGTALGGIVDGCPPLIEISEEILQLELDKRKPGQGTASTTRSETDKIEILSGIFEGKTTGTPIGFIIRNHDHRSSDYSKIANIFRPGHADFSFQAKFGLRDYRGGGRSSGRETVARVAAGAIAQEILRAEGIEVFAVTRELGGIQATGDDYAFAQNQPFFAPDADVCPIWEKRIKEVRAEGDTLGGIVEIVVKGVPAGLGEPVFDKLDACLAKALMSVGAVKGVEIGSGFQAARLKGSEQNDPITPSGFSSNNAGGILGGISTGQDIILRAAVKPIPSIAKEQQTINLKGQAQNIRIGGRHDISAIPRINPVLKAMTLLTITDLLLQDRRLGSRV